MRHVADGDVEHFRPKGRWKQKNGEPQHYPGYYWKAYDWDNLFLACLKCNQREKGDLFPLKNTSTRATHHTMNVDREDRLFVDPEKDNPEDHISFTGQYISGKDDKGKTTIKALNLDRTELDERRLEKLENLTALEDAMLCSKGESSEQKIKDIFYKRLRKYISGEEEYTNMMKCNFNKYLHLL